MVVHAQERNLTRYGTVTLLSSDGRLRNLTAQSLASLVKQSSSLKLVVLQACDKDTACFDIVADALLEHGLGRVNTT
jgi:hypothetical protein